VFRALRGYKVLLAQPGLLVLQGLLEKLVLRDLKVYKVRLGPLARQVKLVLRGLRVYRGQPVLQEQQELLLPFPVLLDLLGLWAPPVKREHRAYRVYKAL
jgi:hypothetical protein